MLTIIEQFLCGSLDIKLFMKMVREESVLQDTIRTLMPKEAIRNRDYPLWAKVSYDAYEKCNFDCLEHLYEICRFDDSFGDNLNFFSILKNVYKFVNPKFQFTERYEKEFAFYLDVVQDCFDGPEVAEVTRELLRELVDIKPKSKRNAIAKQRIKDIFHVEGNNRPRWIQGPEWPMGQTSPMRFIKRIRSGEEVQFHFIDFATGKKRVVRQFY